MVTEALPPPSAPPADASRYQSEADKLQRLLTATLDALTATLKALGEGGGATYDEMVLSALTHAASIKGMHMELAATRREAECLAEPVVKEAERGTEALKKLQAEEAELKKQLPKRESTTLLDNLRKTMTLPECKDEDMDEAKHTALMAVLNEELRKRKALTTKSDEVKAKKKECNSQLLSMHTKRRTATGNASKLREYMRKNLGIKSAGAAAASKNLGVKGGAVTKKKGGDVGGNKTN